MQANTDLPWVVLYVRRWLCAPVLMPDGTLVERDRGTPQGSAVSPVLANLFLHYAFDVWMAREFPTVRFERYVDDAVVHCVSRRHAGQVLAAIEARMVEVGLRLHPDKTRIVYCKDGKRRGSHEHTSFTFLGYTFRPRGARAKDGKMFLSFAPAVSKDALKKISAELRSWRLHQRTNRSFAYLARKVNPIVRGWMNYYGAFYRSALTPFLQRINAYLMRWVRKKYRRLQDVERPNRRGSGSSSSTRGSSRTGPGSKASQLSGDQGDKSRMNREVHVRICESREVRFLPATRPPWRQLGASQTPTCPGGDDRVSVQGPPRHLRVAADHCRSAPEGLAGLGQHRGAVDGRAGLGGTAQTQAAVHDPRPSSGPQGTGCAASSLRRTGRAERALVAVL